MNATTAPMIKRPSLLIKCLAFSLAIHTGLLVYIYKHPLILQQSLTSIFGISAATPELLETGESVDLYRKSQEIDEVFQQILVFSPHLQQPLDLIELPKGAALAPSEELAELIEERGSEIEISADFSPALVFSLPEAGDEEISAEILTTPFEEFPLTSQVQIDQTPKNYEFASLPNAGSALPMAEESLALSENVIEATEEVTNGLALSSAARPMPSFELKTETASAMSAIALEGGDVQELANLLPHPFLSLARKPRLEIASHYRGVEEYMFPPLATAAEWNDDFDLNLRFLPKPDGGGYIFSLTLSPSYDISQYSLKQNILFILDRSSTVQKHRFNVFKRAVLKALSSMQKGDTFNVYIADKGITRFKEKDQPVNITSIQAAEEFLEKQEEGGFFTSSDIYASLPKILPEVQDDHVIHTAILLSDGVAKGSGSKQQNLLKSWVEKNHGKLAIYTAAVGQKNDLVMLDFLSSISGGKMLWSDTHAAFPRKLAKLVIDLRDPLATDLIISVLPHQSRANIEIFPAATHMPNLYSHQPYEIVGTIDEPGTFDLVIQGRHGDEWIAIKKTVSFIDGQKGDHSLEKLVSAGRAHLCYAKFLSDGKTGSLKEAKDILKKARTEIAFE